MARREFVDPVTEWLGYVRPEGLVLGPNVLREHTGLMPDRQGAEETAAMADALALDPDTDVREDADFHLADPWPLFRDVLGWPESHVAGAPGGPDLPLELTRAVPEHETYLSPDWAVLWRGDRPEGAPPVQALVMLALDRKADARGASEGWEASPHQKLERLARETGVEVGVLVSRGSLRLIYAPRGETSGWLDWPLAPLGRVSGRPMMGGLKVALGRTRFFTGPAETRLRPLLTASRKAQNAVSEKLSAQVLGALHELLRGLDAADSPRIRRLAREAPETLYEGLLTTLMRLVFLLYAEDRDLLPTARDAASRGLYESGYSVATLFARLEDDAGRYPDLMDERRGAWGQLLALFRLVHRGHSTHDRDGLHVWVRGRGGKLFDPDAFPFLEGREPGDPLEAAQVLPVSDGCVYRILEGLMTLPAATRDGARERLSYRALDVEQIGSVYETVMGFTAGAAEESMISVASEKQVPTYIGLDSLLGTPSKARKKWLKERAVVLTGRQLTAVNAASGHADLVAALAIGNSRGHRVGAIDRRGSPDQTPLPPGAPYLQPTDERRRSGSHYTPRALTEPIVRHALAPIFARLGEAAKPEDVLNLKVCDPACGSAAFLVEACRQIGARLEAAWARHPETRPAIPDDEDEALHARRLVAQRCLYGVDRNPLATDLARLSLWLATLAADHAFTFLDHALKSGDSLVGLSVAQIERGRWDEKVPKADLFAGLMRARVAEALTMRDAIRTAPDDVERAFQERRHLEAEARIDKPRLYGDAIIAAFFSETKAKAREAAREAVASAIAGGQGADGQSIVGSDYDALRRWRTKLAEGDHTVRPFHWDVEFPEVFQRDNPGFDAIVGNPPFAGKNTISGANGPHYIGWLQALHAGAHGNADLAAHFYRRAFGLLRRAGVFGLVASNTIKQGDTRESGLRAILKAGGAILRATTRHKWEGEAAVVTSFVHVMKDPPRGAPAPVLDGQEVERISAYLVPGHFDDSPHTLTENAGRAFQGSILLGMGFTFDDRAAEKGEAEGLAEMERLIAKDPRNATRIKPYLGGEEVNTSPTHAHHRYAIDFEDFPLRRDNESPLWAEMTTRERTEALRTGIVPGDYPGPVAADWPDLLEIVERLVKPQRLKQSDAGGQAYWWRYLRRRGELYNKAATTALTYLLPRVSPHHSLTVAEEGKVYSDQAVVFAYPNLAPFAALQSRVHETWARFFSSSMKDDLRYAPSDCFETFPFPRHYETDPSLEAAGRAYHDHRAGLMVAADEGMTTTYNRFHDRDETGEAIQSLRDLHAAMDRAVLQAYGWHDLAEDAAPVFLDETSEDDHTYQGRLFWPSPLRDEILARLLALNAERHAAQVKA